MRPATFVKIIALLAGLAILYQIAATTDLRAVALDIARVGFTGAAAILLTFAVGFAADVVSWLLLFRTTVVSLAWSVRLWLVQMVGEGLNVLAPFGSLGGEPFKALLLKRHYNVSYPEGTASLVLIQTVNSLAEIPFAIAGVAFLLHRHILPRGIEMAIAGAVAFITLFMTVVIGVLHFRALAALERRLTRSRWGERLNRTLAAIREIEDHLFYIVRRTPGRFACAFTLAFCNWLLGAVEMFLIFHFLGFPIAMTDAWFVEATVVLVRSGTFFIPAHLGVQDGAIAALAEALTGSAEIGLAAALVRRGRELLWSSAGLAIGAWFGLREPAHA